MKRYFFSIPLFILSLILFTGCSEDFLETDPTDAVSTDMALNNYTNLKKSANGMYAPLRSSNYYGAYMMIAPEIMADNVKRSQYEGSSRYVEEYNLTVGPSVGYYTGLWTEPYYVIRSANNIINAVKSDDFDPGDASEKQIDQLQGEALFVRALAHFDLCRLFAHHYTSNASGLAPGADGEGAHLGIPVVLKTDVNSFPKRNTVEEVYNQVIKDLRKSSNLISIDKGKNYASRNAANALLARVFLYKEQADSARYYAEEVINSGEYMLVEGKEVVDYWVKEEGYETIFQIYSDQLEEYFPGNESLNSLFNIGDKFPYSDLVITEELYNSFADEDTRKNLYYKDENNEVRVKKFLPKEGNTSPFENNIKVLRLAEMYLISAEANYRLGSDGEALNRLNDLRQARGLNDLNDISFSVIAEERRKELACEGHRLFDLARLELDNSRPENNANPMVEYPDHRFILPIPQSELDRNSNITQNPGF